MERVSPTSPASPASLGAFSIIVTYEYWVILKLGVIFRPWMENSPICHFCPSLFSVPTNILFTRWSGFARRPTLPTLKLGTYDGRTSLEAFSEKFNNTGAVPVDETRAAEASRRVDRLESALKEYRRKLDQVRQEDVQLRRDLREGTQRGRRPPSEATAAVDRGQRLSSSGPSAPDSTPLVPSTPPPSSGGRSCVCYGCGSPGHVVKDCPSGRRGARGTQWPEQSETYTEMDFCGTRHRCF